ncbi:MAG: DUF2500 family protein [bacterium]|nr:DUF2500 family protein [bacterium]
MDTNTILVIVVIVGIVALVIYLYIKRLNSAWKGTLIDKQIVQRQVVENSGSRNASGMRTTRMETTYEMKFDTEEGKRIVLSVKEELYNSSVVGEKFEKVKGEYMPKKIEVNAQESTVVQPPIAAPESSIAQAPSVATDQTTIPNQPPSDEGQDQV